MAPTLQRVSGKITSGQDQNKRNENTFKRGQGFWGRPEARAWKARTQTAAPSEAEQHGNQGAIAGLFGNTARLGKSRSHATSRTLNQQPQV